MRTIYTIFIVIILAPSGIYAQYDLKVISINSSTSDSLYMKTGVSDTLWRKVGQSYNVAYVAKQWAYFPFFQQIPAPTTLAGYGITDGLTSSVAAGSYQPVGNYATGGGTATGINTGDNAANTTYVNDYRAANFVAGTNYLAPNGNGSALTGLTALQVGLGNVTNESKATMFTNAVFTGTFTAPNGTISNAMLANSAVANLSGTNSGDNATNTQYSGLAASKQDVLVSGMNIKTINGSSVLGSGDLVVSGGAGLGYTLSIQALTSSPTDAQTIYFGQLPKAPVTTAATSKIYIRKTGTIKMAQVYCYSGTAGTAEAWVMSIRLNNTTDTQISSIAVATNERIFTNSSLSIPVVAGDYIEIKCVNPTWATNPLTTIFGGFIYIE